MKDNYSQNKITPLDHPVLESIENRWSPRVFAKTQITEDQVKILLEAGRWAPSSGNMQPWIVIWGLKGTETFERLFNCLDDFNQQWAANAQMLWINAFKKTMRSNEKENFHALHDLGLFMGNVLHQANSMDIAVHQMAGVRFKDAQKEFELPDDYHVATAAAFGYFDGNPEVLPEDLKRQEVEQLRKRRPQYEFAFNGNFTNKNKKTMEKKKKHADFQDEYKRSSNFGEVLKDDNLEIKGDGNLKITEDEDKRSKEEE